MSSDAINLQMQAVAKLGQCVQRDLRLLHAREQAAQAADAKVSVKHVDDWRVSYPKHDVRHLLDEAHCRPYCMQDLTRSGHSMPVHLQY